MRSTKRLLALAVTGACLLASSIAEAGSVYQFAFGQTTYQVDPGSQVLVDVYLQEQVSGGSASVLASDGLIGVGVRVSFDVSPLPSDPARILHVSDVTSNDAPGGFVGYQGAAVAPGSFADLSESIGILDSPVTATDLGGGLYRILIGTFRFTAGSIADQTTLIQATDIPGLSDTVTGGGADLDSLISAGTASIEVRAGAVPEPSSWVAMALGVIGAGGYGLARRHRPPYRRQLS